MAKKQEFSTMPNMPFSPRARLMAATALLAVRASLCADRRITQRQRLLQ
jgi:hypothetical protein